MATFALPFLSFTPRIHFSMIFGAFHIFSYLCAVIIHIFRTMKTRCFLTLLFCLVAGAVFAQIDLTKKKNDIYVESPILSNGGNSTEQTTFAAMRAPLIKKVSENPKVQTVEDRNCVNKLLTVIQNYKRYTYRDSTDGRFYYRIDFHYVLAIKNTQTNEVLAQGSTKTAYCKSERNFADAFAMACERYPYASDFNEVAEEAFALVGLITKIEPDPKKANRAGKVYIDLGTNDGVRSNQWFDVFLVHNGEVSDRIATLHLDKADATSSVCKPKKGKEDLMKLWNNNSQGAKFAVVSRMEKNIFKKLEKAMDFINVIGDSF